MSDSDDGLWPTNSPGNDDDDDGKGTIDFTSLRNNLVARLNGAPPPVKPEDVKPPPNKLNTKNIVLLGITHVKDADGNIVPKESALKTAPAQPKPSGTVKKMTDIEGKNSGISNILAKQLGQTGAPPQNNTAVQVNRLTNIDAKNAALSNLLAKKQAPAQTPAQAPTQTTVLSDDNTQDAFNTGTINATTKAPMGNPSIPPQPGSNKGTPANKNATARQRLSPPTRASTPQPGNNAPGSPQPVALTSTPPNTATTVVAVNPAAPSDGAAPPSGGAPPVVTTGAADIFDSISVEQDLKKLQDLYRELNTREQALIAKKSEYLVKIRTDPKLVEDELEILNYNLQIIERRMRQARTEASRLNLMRKRKHYANLKDFVQILLTHRDSNIAQLIKNPRNYISDPASELLRMGIFHDQDFSLETNLVSITF